MALMVRNRPIRTAAALAAASLLLSLLGVAPAGAAPAPQLRLVAPTGTLTVERFPDEPLYLDLGTNVVAGRNPLDIRLTRKSYRDPIVARQRLGKRTRTVPAGLLRGWAGFKDFLHLTLTDAAGVEVFDTDQDFCPNGPSVRTRPDAPGTSPYPDWCGTNPWTLGNVLGIQAGWGSATSGGYGGEPVDLADGTYTARISINAAHRRFFAIPADQASVAVEVTVTTVAGEGPLLDAHRHADAGKAPATPAPKPRGVARVPAGPRPDLRALPAWDIATIPAGEGGEGRDQLAFSANVWNAGPSPLVVDGFRRSGTELMDAYQYFYDAKGRQVGWAPTGTFEWDQRAGHVHWHFTDFASYRLLKANRQEAVRSGKEAFCLAPTDSIDLNVKGANWKPASTGLGTSSCGSANSIGIRETLDTGWGDTYSQSLPGQSFDIGDVPNGTYYIEVTANPGGHLYERSKANNRSLRKVVLGGSPGARTVKVPPYQGLDVP
jgi:hypothetical protein